MTIIDDLIYIAVVNGYMGPLSDKNDTVLLQQAVKFVDKNCPDYEIYSKWMNELTYEDRLTILDGEQSEAAEIMKKHNVPEGLHDFLNKWFEEM